MIKTVILTAGTETEVILAGGCHCCIENRGSGVIYASKYSGIVPDSDGVTAIDSGNAKVLRNIAQYKKDDNSSYDYYGKIYLLSDIDTKAEIQTANDLSFKYKNTAKGGGTAYDDTAIKADIKYLKENKANASDLDKYVTKATGYGLSSNDYTTAEKNKLAGLENYDDTTVKNDISMNKTSIAYINALTGRTKRNLWNPTIPSTAGGLTTVIDDDKTFYLSGTASKFTAYLSPQNNSSYFPTGKALLIRGAERLNNCTYMCVKKTAEGTTQYIQIGKNDITISADEQLIHIYIQVMNNASIDVKISPMVCFADEYDGIYEPYIKNDLQTQINSLLARIEALEG